MASEAGGSRVCAVNITTKRNLDVAEQTHLIGQHMRRIQRLPVESPGYYHLTLSELELKVPHA